MAWQKSPPELVTLFDAVLPDDPRIERRKMFGFPAAFLNGNMFAGLFESQFIVKCDTEDCARLLDAGGKRFEPTPGRVMSQYIVLPAAVLASRAKLRRWIERSVAFVATKPPKAKKPKKKSAVTKRDR